MTRSLACLLGLLLAAGSAQAAGPADPPSRWLVGLGVPLGGRTMAYGTSGAGCYRLGQVLLANPILGQPETYRYSAVNPCPSQRYGGGGLHADVAYYPFKDRSDNPYVTGLAARLDGTLHFEGGHGLAEAQGGLELRYELHGLWRERSRLAFLLGFKGHYASFSGPDAPVIDRGKLMMGAEVTLPPQAMPNVSYGYVALGVEAYLPYAKVGIARLGVELQARYHLVFDVGAVGQGLQGDFSGGYGAQSSRHGLRLQVTPVELELRDNVRLGAQLSYEHYRLRFFGGAGPALPPEITDPLPPLLGTRGDDHFIGGLLYVRWQLHQSKHDFQQQQDWLERP